MTYITVDVDINDALAEASDDELLDELKGRKAVSLDGITATDDVRDAYDHLIAGRPHHAAAILHALLFPTAPDEIKASYDKWAARRHD